MAEIEINYKPEIFDDPKFCESENFLDQCWYFRDEECLLFPLNSDLGFIVDKNDDPRFTKCDRCKKHYNEAKGDCQK